MTFRMDRRLFLILAAASLAFLLTSCESNTNFSTTSNPAKIVGHMVKTSTGIDGNAFPCIKPDQNIEDNEITTDRITLDPGIKTVYLAFQGNGGGGGLFTVPAMWYCDPIPVQAVLRAGGRYVVNYRRKGTGVTLTIADEKNGNIVGSSKPVPLKIKGEHPVDWSLYTPVYPSVGHIR